MSAKRILLETPVFNIESALKAAEFGADRLELCSSQVEGGLTPGPGFFSVIRTKIKLPVFVMIRPRGGDFVCSDEEIKVMKEEIRIFSTLGADGFVFGVLNRNGTVRKEVCKELVKAAGEKPCTFHRAFDVTPNKVDALEDIIDCGFKRILTSGGGKKVGEGLQVIKDLLKQANDHIIIMPGGGMKPEYIPALAETGHLTEVHASCKKRLEFNGEVLPGEDETNRYWTVDRDCVEAYKLT